MGDHYPLPPSHSKSCYTCKKNFWFPTLQNNLDYILNYYQRIAPKGFSYWDIMCGKCVEKLPYKDHHSFEKINETSVSDGEGGIEDEDPLELDAKFQVTLDTNEENEPLRLLKMRLALGEITLEEFNKLRDSVKP